MENDFYRRRISLVYSDNYEDADGYGYLGIDTSLLIRRTANPAFVDESGFMYTNFFKLNEQPFSLTPDPRYLYMSERHREGLAHLLYGVRQPGGFIQLTGEIGCGKTTLCRCLVNQLPPETDIALILNPRLTVLELLAAFCDELDIQYPPGTDSIKVLIDALNQHLLQAHAAGRHTVLVIDEAQNLHRDVLEQIRLLTNLETEQEKLLQIILIGQPELINILKDPSLKQLSQRVTARYHLLPLSRRETFAYIQHRLLVAGLSSPIFSRQALNETYRLTDGVPRLINILCDRAMLGAYTLDRRGISKSIVRKAAKEIRATKIRPFHRRYVYAFCIVVLLVLFAAAAITLGPQGVNKIGKKPLGTESQNTPAPDSSNTGVETNRTSAPLDQQNRTEKSLSSAISKDSPPSGTGSESLFEQILRSPSLSGSLGSSFATLYSVWGITPPTGSSELGCAAGEPYGYACLFMTGDWLKLRRLDVPVIMHFQLSNGEGRHGTLVGLTGNTATMAVGNRKYSLPVQEVDRLWDGSFILIWKPPFETLSLPLGMQGDEITWVRHTLDAYEGKPPDSAPSDLFDENLRQRVLSFQRTQLLVQDGRIGPETLLRLTLAQDASGVPLLSRYKDEGEKS